MTPEEYDIFRPLLKKYLDDSVEGFNTAVSLGAWTPTGIDESTEDWELTDEHVKEWLMLEMNNIVDHHLEVTHGVHSDETQNR